MCDDGQEKHLILGAAVLNAGGLKIGYVVSRFLPLILKKGMYGTMEKHYGTQWEMNN